MAKNIRVPLSTQTAPVPLNRDLTVLRFGESRGEQAWTEAKADSVRTRKAQEIQETDAPTPAVLPYRVK